MTGSIPQLYLHCVESKKNSVHSHRIHKMMYISYLYPLSVKSVGQTEISWKVGKYCLDLLKNFPLSIPLCIRFLSCNTRPDADSNPGGRCCSAFFVRDTQSRLLRFLDCVRRSPTLKIWAWRARRMSGRWPDGGRSSAVARWTRRRAAPAYGPTPDIRRNKSEIVWPRWKYCYNRQTLM